MARKFLPFLKEDAGAVDVYKAVTKLFPAHSLLASAAVTYTVLHKGLQDVQGFVNSNSYSDNNAMVSGIIDHYNAYSKVKAADLDMFISMEKFIVESDTKTWNASLKALAKRPALTVIYIRHILHSLPESKYPGFGCITNVESVERCMSDIQSFVRFSDSGDTKVFEDADSLFSFILYTAFISSTDIKPLINPTFNDFGGTSDVPF